MADVGVRRSLLNSHTFPQVFHLKFEEITLLIRICKLAEELMGSKEAVEAWLITPIPALGYQRPIDSMETPEGAQLILDTLHRVQHGVYS